MGLKANELRIGNKIFFIICNKENSNLDEKKQITVDITDFEFIRDNNSLFEGIPLTEEWLLKFGLKNIRFKYEINKFIIWLDPRSTYYHLNYEGGSIEIRYVHQLQNLYYFLTYNELEIKM